jgi:c-di-AMP phosphodiesterase-like protein
LSHGRWQLVSGVQSKDFYCSSNQLASLKNINRQIKKMNGKFYAHGNPSLTKNLVGLILIDGLTKIEIDNKEIEAILNSHVGQPNRKKAMLTCQQELIEAGFEEAADL